MLAYVLKGQSKDILLQLKQKFNVESDTEALERALLLADIATQNSSPDGIVTILKPDDSSKETVKIR